MSEDDNRLRVVKDWRPLFPRETVEAAGTKAVQGRITSFWGYSWIISGSVADTVKGTRGRPRKVYYDVRINNIPTGITDEWDQDSMRCSCPEGRKGLPCIHKAAILLKAEKENGPFIAVETEWEYRQRMTEEAKEREREKLKAMKEKLGYENVPALTYFSHRKDPEGLIIWDVRAMLEDYYTNAYEIERARQIMENKQIDIQCRETETREGIRVLYASCSTCDIVSHTWQEASSAEITGRTGRITRTANSADLDYEAAGNVTVLNGPELLMLRAMWNYADVQARNNGDMTDKGALAFFSSMNEKPQQAAETAAAAENARTRDIELYPRIVIEDGEAKLSFKVGEAGGRLLVLKNFQSLVDSVLLRGKLSLSKTSVIDFGKHDFTEASIPYYEFISRRVGEIHDANEKIESRNYFRSVRTIAVKGMFELKGAALDNFYDIADGQECSYTDKTNKIKDAQIRIGYQPLHFSINAKRLSDARGVFAGVSVYGLIPVLLEGSTHRYILNSSYLSRVTPDERRRLVPFQKVADSSGYFRFHVGRDYLQEFYYRIVPRLLESPGIILNDEVEEEAREYLPPEPAFTFYLDVHPLSEEHPERKVLTLRGTVSYGDSTYNLGDPPAENEYHDKAQEKRVEQAVGRFFNVHKQHYYESVVSDDELYDFLREGISSLEEYGEVKGSEAFRKIRIRPVPQIKLGISVESGIMNLSLTSDELDRDELLEIYRSYHQRRRWHKLSSGDYLDLGADDQMREIDDIFKGMDISAEEAIGKKLSLPVYRALYLDRLLEKHDEITSSRDRVYRALVRNFKTVQDSETEPPASLEQVLRPYQTYGYKWLMTLSDSGFGGILADEMGLGKTLQMISVLLSRKEADPEGHMTSLIVCPASLVYNWQEEFTRFAPDLDVKPLTGGAAARRKALEDFQQTDVYIISYDLMKRHISKIQPLSFEYIVLDEAQYIKNAGAAVTRSVKALNARHRFALTGTPIENRLSELWSIFDFLMPGFLYSQGEFSRKFETPIVKNKDQAAVQKLYAMTAPFILRRKKSDVLKDLPPKLEEVRYVQLSGEQQKLYDAQVLRIKNEVDPDEKIKILAELTKIREICCDPSLLFEDYHGESVKRTACMDLIGSAIDGGHRMLVFSQFTSMLALLEQDLKKEGIEYYILTGSTSKEKRLQMVHSFNEGSVPVFLISLKAGGTGLNLTGADVVIHYDPWWNIAAQNQATDRTHRIGQTRQVTVYKMIIKNTIEERILELQETKKDLADSMTEGRGNPLASLSKEELLALL